MNNVFVVTFYQYLHYDFSQKKVYDTVVVCQKI